MINRLTDIYERWTTVNELPAQSADEHDRDKLTEEQIKWLNEFSEHWHNQVDIDHFIDDNTPKFFELPKNTIIKFGEYEHNVLNGSIDVSNEKGTVIKKDEKSSSYYSAWDHLCQCIWCFRNGPPKRSLFIVQSFYCLGVPCIPSIRIKRR